MGERKYDSRELERVMAYLSITRDPKTRNFLVEMSVRKDWDSFAGKLTSRQSPTRLVWSLRGPTLDAFDHLVYNAVTERWGAELERDVVDVSELVTLLEPPTD